MNNTTKILIVIIALLILLVGIQSYIIAYPEKNIPYQNEIIQKAISKEPDCRLCMDQFGIPYDTNGNYAVGFFYWLLTNPDRDLYVTNLIGSKCVCNCTIDNDCK